MGDLAAVVRGLRDAGAGEILVLDGHGMQAFVPHLMEPGAKYITSEPGAKHASDPPDNHLLWGSRWKLRGRRATGCASTP